MRQKDKGNCDKTSKSRLKWMTTYNKPRRGIGEGSLDHLSFRSKLIVSDGTPNAKSDVVTSLQPELCTPPKSVLAG